MVSGGDDRGEVMLTTTIACSECKVLHDVPTRTPGSKGRWKVHALQCPSGKHHVRRWTNPGDCPKCGSGMVDGGLVEIWD
jgi:hypothetical protein